MISKPGSQISWITKGVSSSTNPYYTVLLTNIDSDSGMHLNMFFWSQHRAGLLWGGTSSWLEKCEGYSRGAAEAGKRWQNIFVRQMISFPPHRGLYRNSRSGITDLTALSALLFLNGTKVPKMVSKHQTHRSCPENPAFSWCQNVLTSKHKVSCFPDLRVSASHSVTWTFHIP